MKLYSIKDWEKFYEVSDSKKVSGPLQWVPVRTKTDGFGYLRITQERTRTDLLSAWYLMLGVAAKLPREQRGKLWRDGVPLTAIDLELMTRFPASIFAKALVFFSDQKQGWLTCTDVPDSSGCCPDVSGQARMVSGDGGSTGQDNTVEDRTGQDSRANAADAASATDEEWLKSLETDPAYQGIDTQREYAKAKNWCVEHKKTLSRKRFINWLNRTDRPMNAEASQSHFTGKRASWA